MYKKVVFFKTTDFSGQIVNSVRNKDNCRRAYKNTTRNLRKEFSPFYTHFDLTSKCIYLLLSIFSQKNLVYYN